MRSIYIHIPFCVHKCFYCDFYSIEQLDYLVRFVEALIKEIDLTYSVKKSDSDFQSKSEPISSVFLGGGTPSLLRPRYLENIITCLNKYYTFASNAEWTIECNPETVQPSVLKEYKQLGVNRLSIGIQSFIDSELKFLERIHNSRKAEKAVEYARTAGFDNINLDLMFAIPGQTLESWEYTLYKTISLKPEHISAYSLIYEPSTPLYESFLKGKIKKTDDANDTAMYRMCIDKLANAGYIQYEVSNYALEERKCRHNLNYWLCGEYYGFGPSAHGFIDGKRYWNFSSLKKYYEKLYSSILPIENTELIGKNEMLAEFIMLGLRSGGINIDLIHNKFGLDLLDVSGNLIKRLITDGKMNKSGTLLSLTHDGYFVSDEIIVEIISALEKLKVQTLA